MNTLARLAQGRISVIDPLGTALLGACVGDVIELPVANGRRHLRVEEIIFQPEQSLRYGLVINHGES